MNTLPLGPLAFPVAVLWLVLALIAALVVSHFVSRGRGARVADTVWVTALAGAAIGRLGFVLRYWSQYAGHPLGILDIRDRGFDPLSAVIGMAVCAAFSLWRRPELRRPLALALATGVGVWAATGGAFALMQAQQPMRPATLTLQTLEGAEVTLGQLAVAHPGEPMVVNLWATWCPPCRAEMPMLAAAQDRYQDVVFVFANQGESANQVHRFLAAESLEAMDNVLLDSGHEVAHSRGVRAYPTTLFYDASGRLVDTHMGMLSPATLARSLDIAGPSSATALSDTKEPQ